MNPIGMRIQIDVWEELKGYLEGVVVLRTFTAEHPNSDRISGNITLNACDCLL